MSLHNPGLVSDEECSGIQNAVDLDGFAIVPKVLTSAEQSRLIETLGPVDGAGRRGLLAQPLVAELARSERLLEIVRPHLPIDPLPIRAIYFDKSPDANWLVPWHQDLTIAVQTRADVPGFGPWSEKNGNPHVQPPAELLEQMLSVRLHLDAADESNGALRVIPRSHRFGRLSVERIPAIRRQLPEVVCTSSAGDALLMRPLLLHASSRSTSARHRRILHIEYAGFPLPRELAWQEAA
jgi:hypothetical protein